MRKKTIFALIILLCFLISAFSYVHFSGMVLDDSRYCHSISGNSMVLNSKIERSMFQKNGNKCCYFSMSDRGSIEKECPKKI